MDGYIAGKLLISSFFVFRICAAGVFLLHLSLGTAIIKAPSNSIEPFMVSTKVKRICAITVYSVLLYSCRPCLTLLGACFLVPLQDLLVVNIQGEKI